MKVDLNADMGESFGPWVMGDDAALMDVITSANIACGWHAGDADVMATTMRAAVARGVGIGAHPGFADLQGFGRRRIALSAEELGNLTAYQLGAAQGMARMAGARVRHLKLHGALSNMASEDATIARACYSAARRLDPDIVLVVLAGTAQQAVAEELAAPFAAEIFADRAYNDDATLVDRRLPEAVLHDAAQAGPRIAAMIRARAIITASGKHLPARIDTVCVHGDSPDAVAMARALRSHLTASGISVSRF
ncbi:LamB/YcsF family protein [Paracoccus sp. (in: a-proteobacteria)]|uniref:LamB/YcsF family protein n=1 Tax=Paracoccus sp. TaxID=267 RepID=UPI0026DEF42F|nr:5-oxoprolinase subunit PxpA [Paracoccus sp. (in: a-proteobacteria)]MDO5647778.1 5-oxoprolinase subunit PxpA [Paracoccus sp. (in: a-proteobacteria)]